MLKALSLSVTLCLFALIFLLTGCSSSPELITSWRDPNSTLNFSSLNKILVIAALDDDYNRKFTENRIAARLGDAGVKSYEYFNLKELGEKKEFFIQKFKDEKFDGAIVLRVVYKGTQRDIAETMPTFYLDYWNFYDYYSGVNMNQGKMSIQDSYLFEVNVFSFENNKLIWSGLTSWIDPTTDLDKVVHSVADLIGDKMKEEKFLIRP